MTAFTDSEDGGIVRSLTLDGLDIEFPATSMNVSAPPLEESVDTIDGSSVLFGVVGTASSPNRLDRYQFDIPYTSIKGPARKALARALARGGFHSFCHWKPIFAAFTASDGQTIFHLPRRRSNAGQVLAGLTDESGVVGTDSFPVHVWINGDEQTVTYDTGPMLGDPGADTVVIAKNPETSGAAEDYVPFRVGNDLVAGDLVEVEFFPVFSVQIKDARYSFPKSVQESHSYTLLER